MNQPAPEMLPTRSNGAAAEPDPPISQIHNGLPLDPGTTVVQIAPSSDEFTTLDAIRGALAGHDLQRQYDMLLLLCAECGSSGEEHDAHAKRQRQRALVSTSATSSPKLASVKVSQVCDLTMGDLVHHSLLLIADHWGADWDRIELDKAMIEIRRRGGGAVLEASSAGPAKCTEAELSSGDVVKVERADCAEAVSVSVAPAVEEGMSSSELKASISDIFACFMGSDVAEAGKVATPKEIEGLSVSASTHEEDEEEEEEEVIFPTSEQVGSECSASSSKRDDGSSAEDDCDKGHDEETIDAELDSDDSDDDDARDPSQADYGDIQTTRDPAEVLEIDLWISDLESEIQFTRSSLSTSRSASCSLDDEDSRMVWMDARFVLPLLQSQEGASACSCGFVIYILPAHV